MNLLLVIRLRFHNDILIVSLICFYLFIYFLRSSRCVYGEAQKVRLSRTKTATSVCARAGSRVRAESVGRARSRGVPQFTPGDRRAPATHTSAAHQSNGLGWILPHNVLNHYYYYVSNDIQTRTSSHIQPPPPPPPLPLFLLSFSEVFFIILIAPFYLPAFLPTFFTNHLFLKVICHLAFRN